MSLANRLAPTWYVAAQSHACKRPFTRSEINFCRSFYPRYKPSLTLDCIILCMNAVCPSSSVSRHWEHLYSTLQPHNALLKPTPTWSQFQVSLHCTRSLLPPKPTRHHLSLESIMCLSFGSNSQNSPWPEGVVSPFHLENIKDSVQSLMTRRWRTVSNHCFDVWV